MFSHPQPTITSSSSCPTPLSLPPFPCLGDNRQANRHFHHQIAKPLDHLRYNTQEPVGLSLFASSRAAVFIADSLASTESPALTRVPAAVAPEASREKLQGPYRGPDCFQQHTFIREPKALSELIWWNRTSPSAHGVEESTAHESLEGR
ncbi:MADS-box transcription enhancer factor 2D [Sarotherodon galilaeus]